MCQHLAPRNFARDDETGYSYVYKQPETPEELAQCIAAVKSCPVAAIGADGEDDEPPKKNSG
jgi:ferredoxin